MAKLVRPVPGPDAAGGLRGTRGLVGTWTGRCSASLYVLVSVCSAAFPGILCYIVLGILMPPEE